MILVSLCAETIKPVSEGDIYIYIDFHEISKRMDLLIIRFEIMLSQQFRTNESWGTRNQCKPNASCVFSFGLCQ